MAGEKNSKYKPEYDELAYNYCLLGATDNEIAAFMGVTEQTINNWKKDHPTFFESLKAGKAEADARVAKALFSRALGYEHEEDDIKAVNGEIVITPTIKRYPPDPTSMIFWLKNRQPKLWRDKPVDDGGDENAPPVNITFNVRDKVDIEKLEVEIEEKIKQDRID